ncbi:glycosyltransferase family 4 protein [Sphingomonas piscis]|uniref:Glycosyltransferase family 4 protein n=1 Tax=Sphingomonas piscis TaxID=2714943 RepID=A0A6G7YMX0_9SPHN|nr:glycosyltransferase [Sphingomonas piscis]QIK78066.1 glycosyltransferase family 4 protein [Sphingomonas piscis]
MRASDEKAGKLALIVCDGKNGPTATQMISFGQPFTKAVASPYRIAFEKNLADVGAVEASFTHHSPDILVLSRCTSELGGDWIRLARAAGIPVVFHIDDDLLAVPASLGESKFKAYNRPERLQALRNNIEGCDLLYVSTAGLAVRFAEHGVRTPTVAGDIYCAVAEEDVGALVGPSSGPVIGYMGTAGHSADLAMIMPAVCELMRQNPSLNFEVFGTIKMPAELDEFGTRARHIPPVADYTDFLPFLRSLGWWIGLAPLEDNSFNGCKADTKWVEYSLAGMAVVASDLPVYDRACSDGAGMLAKDTDRWRTAVGDLLQDPTKRNAMIDTAQSKLRQTYTHGKLREQVIAIFDEASRIAERRGFNLQLRRT